MTDLELRRANAVMKYCADIVERAALANAAVAAPRAHPSDQDPAGLGASRFARLSRERGE